MIISPRSRWHDEVWRIDISRPGVTDALRTINWRFKLHDGSRFSDPQWADLRETARRFLWSLRTDPPDGKRRLSLSTLISVFSQIRVLTRWMIGEGYTRFAQFDANVAADFLAMTEGRKGRNAPRLTVGTRAGYLVTIGRLYAQREKLPDPVPEDIGHFLDEYRPRNRRIDRAGRAIPFTPDAVATALINGALRLIGMPADDVLALRDFAAKAFNHRATRRPSDAQERAARLRVETFAFATLPGEATPWHGAVGTLKDVNALIGRIYDACYVVIGWLVGARVSEILGLEAGCIERHRSADGADITYLHGRIYKTATGSGGKPHRWVAPDPVIRAIDVLERLSEPARQIAGSTKLWLMTRDLTLLSRSVSIPHCNMLGRHLNGPFQDLVELPLHCGKRWHLTTHQGRKTFARFIGKRDRTGLYALQQHLGHISRIMTDSAYVGTDFELAELIGEETMNETRAALEDLLTANALSGQAGRMIAARSRFRGRTRGGDLKEYVDFILRDTGMVLGVCDWGYCLYRREHSACRGDEHGPNGAWRTQSICAHCANFAVSKKHQPVWEERRRRNASLLTRSDLDPESRKLAQQRIAECDTVLAGLDDGACHGEG
ncbi:MAG: integrase [Sphingomonadales bacterium]|nr:integrase [Sphingomonadales bacterium]MDE2171929.1 integrase [Sphingomonadales bacterium]